MPYVYPDTVRGEPRNAFTVPSSNREVLTETFAQAYEENPLAAANRYFELREDERTGPKMSAERARARLKDAGMDGDLTVSDAGITEAALLTLMERKRIEKRRQETFALAENSPTQLASRFGIAFATTLADPVSAGLNFVPVVGQARYARWLSTARTLAGRIGVRAAVGAAEGTAGAAIAEIPIHAMRTQEQADYDMTDSLLNVAFGGVVGAGLHSTVGSFGELLARPARKTARVEQTVEARSEELPADIQRALFDMEDVVDRLPSQAQQVALRTAVSQAAEGRPVDVAVVINQQSAPVEFSAPYKNDRGFDEIFAKVDNGNGGNAEMLLELRDDGTARPKLVSNGLREERSTGNGAVTRLYESAIHEAEKRGLRFTSDDSVTVGAARVWDRLRARGYQVQKNPQARLASPPEVMTERWLTADSSPVFRITSVPAEVPRVSPHATDAREVGVAEFAETTLAREIEPTPEAAAKAIEEEATLADTDARSIAERLGVKYEPDEALTEGLEKAERWARVAELATVCLVRGG